MEAKSSAEEALSRLKFTLRKDHRNIADQAHADILAIVGEEGTDTEKIAKMEKAAGVASAAQQRVFNDERRNKA